jgi:hypothetical protein
MQNSAQETAIVAATVEAAPQNTSRPLKDLLYPFPIVGSIKMGEISTTPSGQRLPKKNKYFTLASQVKARLPEGGYDTAWIPHPLQAELIKQPNLTMKVNNEPHLKSIPIRIMFNDPGLTFRERYEAFDAASKQIACASIGNGKAITHSHDGLKEVVCPQPSKCEFGRTHNCRPKGRLTVQVEGHDDPMSGFMLRTSGYNSIRTLHHKLKQLHSMFGGQIAYIPMELTIRAKLTPKGEMYYADLVTSKEKLFTAAAEAKTMREAEAAAGIDRVAYEAEVARMLSNGPFEESIEDVLNLEDWEPSLQVEIDETDDTPLPAPAMNHGQGLHSKGAATGPHTALTGSAASPALTQPQSVSVLSADAPLGLLGLQKHLTALQEAAPAGAE